MPDAGSGGKTRGKGNAQIPDPRSKKAPLVRMGQTEGKNYGTDPHKKGPNSGKSA